MSEVEVESLASTRVRRANAGSRMASLMDESLAGGSGSYEGDEFYKTSYGGFAEEAEDDDYQLDESDSDEVDSDFDQAEDDELKSDDDDGEDKPKKKPVYKEPKLKAPKTEKSKVKREKITKPIGDAPEEQCILIDKKTLRLSTQRIAEESEARAKKEKEASELRKKKAATIEVKSHIMTQEEMLEEAKITEMENLKSLEEHQLMVQELKKKKVKAVKAIEGPMIRYHSVTMPLIEVLDSGKDEENKEVNINDNKEGEEGKEKDKPEDKKEEKCELEKDDESSRGSILEGLLRKGLEEGPDQKDEEVEVPKKCSRTFVSFDEETYKSLFPKPKPPKIRPKFCAITQMPARYFDPFTSCPFSNKLAFASLRRKYDKHWESQSQEKEKGKEKDGEDGIGSQEEKNRQKGKDSPKGKQEGNETPSKRRISR